jgi:hypothetical protein
VAKNQIPISSKIGVTTLLASVFGRGGKPIDQCTDSQVRGSLVFGTVIGVAMLAGSFYCRQQPDWFLWIGRAFVLLFLAQWWRRHLREFTRRQRNR